MIDSILLKNIASYDPNGVEISDLKRLNFFFGSNGSGKSTIARYLDSLRRKAQINFQIVQIMVLTIQITAY